MEPAVRFASLDATMANENNPASAGLPSTSTSTAAHQEAEQSDEDSIESLEDALQRQDDEGWEDVEDDSERLAFISLFDTKSFPDLPSMLSYDRENHGFDLLETRKALGLDFMESMKLVNYIRSNTRKGEKIVTVTSKEPFADDSYLQPALEDDAVLFNLEDTEEIPEEDANEPKDAQRRPDEASGDAFLREVEARPDHENLHQASKVDKNDSSYFESYSFREIHEVMLKDTARTDAYRDFIYGNKDLFEGKVVLDVGCGTGILSMMSAKAGASRVFAVDNSAIIEKARVNVFVNKLDDRISCLRGKVEEIQLPVDHVDIIVSEWMGYGLLYEAMLDSVIFARDKWLRPNGLMVPSDIRLFLAPLADSELVMDKISFWNDVYGFDMTSMQENIYHEPLVEGTPMSTVVSSLDRAEREIRDFDLHKTKVEDLVFDKAPFNFKLTQDIDALDGFALWFDAIFRRDQGAGEKGSVTLSTSPQAKDTHWHQVKLLIDRLKRKPVPLSQGQQIKGSVSYAKSKENPRQLVISAEWAMDGEPEQQGQLREEGAQSWSLE